MTCRAILVALFAVSACFDDVPVVEMKAAAFVDVMPELPFEPHDAIGTFRWGVLESPERSIVSRAESTGPRPLFQFNRRGVYLLERWIVSGLSERLTHHVVVTVSGAAPVASVTGTRYLAVGEVAELDPGASSSPELRPLTYHWQLATRPALSQLVIPLEDVGGDMLSIVPDVVGMYVVEVVAFDGELWSEPATILVEAHD